MPGSTQKVVSSIAQYCAPTIGAEVVIQNDQNYISSLTQAPQNVLRLTGSFGTSYIQGSNIGFSMPYSGTVGVRILPSTNQINVPNIKFLSSMGVATYNINMNQLASTIQGYGWANVS